jgi:formate dehydrogenase subunit delta
MANQIAQYFASQPDRAGRAQCAQSEQMFWAPSMRKALLAWQTEHHGEDFTPLVQAAVTGAAGGQPND